MSVRARVDTHPHAKTMMNISGACNRWKCHRVVMGAILDSTHPQIFSDMSLIWAQVEGAPQE
jgi:hypothetical protein